MPPPPLRERFGDQGPQAFGIGESGAEISAEFALELRQLLFVAPDFFGNPRTLPLRHEPVTLKQLGWPVAVRIDQEGQHLLPQLPRVIAFQPGNTLGIGIWGRRCWPSWSMRT